MSHEHIGCGSDGDPLYRSALAPLQIDVRHQFIIGIATNAVVCFIGEQSQLFRSGNLIGIFGSAVTASVCFGHRAVPAVGLLVAIIRAFVIKHFTINKITAQVIYGITTVNLTNASTWIREQSIYFADAFNDGSFASIEERIVILVSSYGIHMLHTVGMAFPCLLLNGLHLYLERTGIHFTNPRFSHFGIEVVKCGEGLQSLVIPIHLTVFFINILGVAVATKKRSGDDAAHMPLDEGVAFHSHPIISDGAVHEGADIEVPFRALGSETAMLRHAIEHEGKQDY